MDPSPRYVVSMLAALSAGGAVSISFVFVIYLEDDFPCMISLNT